MTSAFLRPVILFLLALPFCITAAAQYFSPPMWFPGTPCPPGATTWNPADKDAAITLSNANLTATQATAPSSWRSVRATSSHTTGKRHWEVSISYDSLEGWIAGLADATASLSNYSGSNTHSVGCQQGAGAGHGQFYYNGGATPFCSATSSGAGGSLIIEADLTGNLWWSRDSSGDNNWNNNPSADPAAGIGGLALHIAGGTAVYPSWSGFDGPGTNDIATINPNGCTTPFIRTPSSGFTAWDAP